MTRCAAAGVVGLQVTSGTLTNNATITTSTGAATVQLLGSISSSETLQIHDNATFGPGTATLNQTGGTTTVAARANLDLSASAGPLMLAEERRTALARSQAP